MKSMKISNMDFSNFFNGFVINMVYFIIKLVLEF